MWINKIETQEKEMSSKMLSYFIVTFKPIKTRNKKDTFLQYVLLLW